MQPVSWLQSARQTSVSRAYGICIDVLGECSVERGRRILARAALLSESLGE